MQTLRYLPLVAIAGAEGFTIFLPYVVLLLAAAYVVERVKTQPPPQPAPAA